MPVSLGARPSPDFNDPLGLLSDCHRRIEHFLDVLIRLAEQPSGPLPPSHREALETALRYFRSGAPRHTRDEEDSLFPRLRARGSAEAAAAIQDLNRLEEDHKRADAAQAEVDAIGSQWLSDGALPEQRRQSLLSRLLELRELYASHIALEDNDVFPMARKVLNAHELGEVGKEMAGRRGISR